MTTPPTRPPGPAVSVDDAWNNADMVVKVKEPIAQEYGHLREDLTLFTYLHLAASRDPDRSFAQQWHHGHRVRDGARWAYLAATRMSEIARAAVDQHGHPLHAAPRGGPGILMGRVRVWFHRWCWSSVVAPWVSMRRAAVGLGADVTVLDASGDRIRELDLITAGSADSHERPAPDRGRIAQGGRGGGCRADPRRGGSQAGHPGAPETPQAARTPGGCGR